MIVGSSGRYLAAQTARDHGSGAGPGAESATVGAGATIEVPGPSRPAVTPCEPHLRTIVPVLLPAWRVRRAAWADERRRSEEGRRCQKGRPEASGVDSTATLACYAHARRRSSPGHPQAHRAA